VKKSSPFFTEEKRYLGSIVLGMNDALVELTGALAGLTLALQNTKIIALVGLITGIAASLSMASSEYFSRKTERSKRKPLLAAFYTGSVYFLTVLILISPFFLFSNALLSLSFTVLNALLIIAAFTYYISYIQNISFKKRFFEMALVSLSIALLSFVIGYLLRIWIGVEI